MKGREPYYYTRTAFYSLFIYSHFIAEFSICTIMMLHLSAVVVFYATSKCKILKCYIKQVISYFYTYLNE